MLGLKEISLALCLGIAGTLYAAETTKTATAKFPEMKMQFKTQKDLPNNWPNLAEAALSEDILNQYPELKKNFIDLKAQALQFCNDIEKKYPDSEKYWRGNFDRMNIFTAFDTVNRIFGNISYEQATDADLKEKVNKLFIDNFKFAQRQYKLFTDYKEIEALYEMQVACKVRNSIEPDAKSLFERLNFDNTALNENNLEKALNVINAEGEALLDKLAESTPNSEEYKNLVKKYEDFRLKKLISLWAFASNNFRYTLRMREVPYEMELEACNSMADYFAANPQRVELMWIMNKNDVPRSILKQRTDEINKFKEEMGKIMMSQPANAYGSYIHSDAAQKDAIKENKIPEAVFYNKVINVQDKLNLRFSELTPKTKDK